MTLINCRVSVCVIGVATILVSHVAIAQSMSSSKIAGIRGQADTEQLARQGVTASLPTNQKKPLTAEEYFIRGTESYLQQKYENAIADFDQAILLDSDYAEAYYNRGKVRSKLGDIKGAFADYDKAIELKPDFEAYLNRGVARANLGDTEGAIPDFNKAIELKSSQAAYYNRGKARDELGDTEGALADYNKAIEIDQTFAEAYYNRGISRDKLGDTEGAIADFAKSAKLFKQQGNQGLYDLATYTLETARSRSRNY